MWMCSLPKRINDSHSDPKGQAFDLTCSALSRRSNDIKHLFKPHNLALGFIVMLKETSFRRLDERDLASWVLTLYLPRHVIARMKRIAKDAIGRAVRCAVMQSEPRKASRLSSKPFHRLRYIWRSRG